MFGGKIKDFLGKPAPAGYIAGLGRGATGFMTRPDIGPARDNIVIGEDDNVNDEPFDEDEVGLLGRKSIFSGFNDPEDDEADRIYAEIDEKMAERRRSRRQKAEEVAEKKEEQQRPKTQLLFADLKRDLSRVSEAEWAAIPEVGDFRVKRLKRSGALENAKERFLPVPDSVHSGHLNQMGGMVVEDEAEKEADLIKIGEARGKLLGMHLDQVEGGVGNALSDSNEANVYNSYNENIAAIAEDDKLAQIGDLKRARQLFASIIKSNRKNPIGWISAARLEVQAGNLKQARALIVKATQECSKAEEVWMEALKLHEGLSEVFRETLAKALKNVPESINLWLMAAERETEISVKRKIIRGALERNPTSAKLWMFLVELEDENSAEEARLILSRAVECASESVELWLALARLQEDFQDARQVLNRARQACPKSFEIWVNAGRLEEANDASEPEIRKLLTRGALELSTQGVQLTWNDWRKQAEECAEGGDIVCAAELMKIGTELVLENDPQISQLDVIEECRNLRHFVCVKGALTTLLDKMEDKVNVVKVGLLLISKMKAEAAAGEEHIDDYGDNREIKQIYEKILPFAGVEIWIKYAREFRGESDGILAKASSQLPDAEDQVKIGREAIVLSIDTFRARPQVFEEFIGKRRSFLDCSELLVEFMRVSAVLGFKAKTVELSQMGIEKFPLEAEFWLGAFEASGRDDLSLLQRGLAVSDWTSVPLALKLVEHLDANEASVLLEKCKSVILKKRKGSSSAAASANEGYDCLLAAICLLNCPKHYSINVLPEVFNPLPRIKSSLETASLAAGKLIVNQGLKECPKSEILWYLAVGLEARHLRRSKAVEAQKRLNDTSLLINWTLAVLLEGPAREIELKKASSAVDGLNVDFLAFVDAQKIEGCDDWRKAGGFNFKRFIERGKHFFEDLQTAFNLFKNEINSK